ncbi:hypothetical protein [Actinomadura oligospora]|uniref:hypothetical protein n=1 Tax=Actinomadura oligospora TaxID=111804 RepID=UPI0004B5FF86|nr:hypothetical protein [Actinomadura oligospora]
MSYEEALSGVRALCVETLGEHIGSQLAALARPGFDLRPADERNAATGLCRWGGPALLEPGTPWPAYAGVPHSLFAVLDVAALGPGVADQAPPGAALLNFFFLDPWTGSEEVPDDVSSFSDEELEEYLVVPADPRRAVEVPAPEPSPRFDQVPMHARLVVTLPSASTYDCDPVLHTLDIGDEVKASELYRTFPGFLVVDRFGEEVWPRYGEDAQDIPWGGMSDQAFGWPSIHNSGVPLLEDLSQDEPYVHLLTLGANDMWEGSLRFVAPAKAIREGDLTQVRAAPENW